MELSTKKIKVMRLGKHSSSNDYLIIKERSYALLNVIGIWISPSRLMLN